MPITIVASFFVTTLALRYFARVSWADSSRTLALPISLYVSIIALAQGVMSEDGILIANAILAPVAGGVIFFASLSGVGNTEVQTETNASSFVLPSLLLSALPYFLLAQFIEFEHSLFFEIPTWVFCLLTFSSFFFFQRRNENLVDRIVNAGCYNFIFQSGYMVFVYASGIFRSGVDEHFTIYVSSVVSYMFPPIVFFLVALMVAPLNGRTTEVTL